MRRVTSNDLKAVLPILCGGFLLGMGLADCGEDEEPNRGLHDRDYCEAYCAEADAALIELGLTGHTLTCRCWIPSDPD